MHNKYPVVSRSRRYSSSVLLKYTCFIIIFIFYNSLPTPNSIEKYTRLYLTTPLFTIFSFSHKNKNNLVQNNLIKSISYYLLHKYLYYIKQTEKEFNRTYPILKILYIPAIPVFMLLLPKKNLRLLIKYLLFTLSSYYHITVYNYKIKHIFFSYLTQNLNFFSFLNSSHFKLYHY